MVTRTVYVYTDGEPGPILHDRPTTRRVDRQGQVGDASYMHEGLGVYWCTHVTNLTAKAWFMINHRPMPSL